MEEARLSLEYEFLRQKQEAAEAENRLVTRLPKALGEKVERLEEKVERLGKSAKSTEAKLEEGWEGFKERPLAVLQGAASYGQGVWLRLNGGGRSMRKGAAAVLDTLPAARASKQEHEARMVSLALAAEEVRARPRRRTGAEATLQPLLARRDGVSVLRLHPTLRFPPPPRRPTSASPRRARPARTASGSATRPAFWCARGGSLWPASRSGPGAPRSPLRPLRPARLTWSPSSHRERSWRRTSGSSTPRSARLG